MRGRWKWPVIVAAGILIGAINGTALHFWETPPVEAQSQEKPDLYLIGKYAGLTVYWFERGDTECYLSYNSGRMEPSTGISCLRKQGQR